MSVLATFAWWQKAHSLEGASAADSAYGNGWCPKVKKPQPFVLANRLLSFTVTSIPLYVPLKNPRPDGSAREPSGNFGSRTRVNSFTIIVPSGKEPVFWYASTFFPSMYTWWYSGNPAFPLLRALGVRGAPTT